MQKTITHFCHTLKLLHCWNYVPVVSQALARFLVSYFVPLVHGHAVVMHQRPQHQVAHREDVFLQI